MALSKEQLAVLSNVLHGPDLDYHQLSIVGEAVRALDMELHRLTHGPFTLAEAVSSGRPFKRPGWNDYATVLVDSDDDGYMCFVFAAAGPLPSKPSSREQRRARKAAKNLYMWRTFGDRRKWNENRFSRSSCGRYPMRCGKNDWILINANDTLYLNGAHGLRNVRHDVLAALREPSGFKYMSAIADSIGEL